MTKGKDDRISALPDDTLCHILSFLPTKLAFSTAILSKRWALLRHSLTSLNFHYDGDVNDRKAFDRFLRFVDAAMLFPRGDHQPIRDLALNFPEEDNFKKKKEVSNKVREWIEVAKRRRLESLEICRANVATNVVFVCKTLVVLKLISIEVGKVSSIDLPSLKTLHLSVVRFRKGEDFQKILYSAPILEDLYLDRVNSEFSYFAADKTLPNLLKLHLRTISASEFQIIQMDHLSKHISSSVFPNLIDIELFFSFGPFYYGWNGVVQVLHQCPKLQNLVIQKIVRAGYYEKPLEYSESVPECVSSHLRTCSIGPFLKEDLRFASYIMENARFLEAMTICPSQRYTKQERRTILKNLSALPRISPVCKTFNRKL